MPRGKNTKEYQTVKKSYPNLSDAIASVIEWACERLLAKGLITDSQRAAASNGFVDAKNRASTVTGLLLTKIEQDTKYFQMLVDVLQQDMDTFGTVLEQMGVPVDDDSSRNARGVSDKPQVQRKRKVRSAASGSDLEPAPTTKRKKKECGAASSPTEFSDALSPTELVSWLSQQFQAKGLTLDSSLRQKLTENDINGEAFVDLEDSDLVEMGFTKGQRMKIVKIIQSITGSKEENGSSQTEAASKPVQTVKATSGAPGKVRSSGRESGPAPKKRKMDSGNVRSSGKESGPAPKKRRMDSDLNDKPSMDQLLNFKDGTSKINIPQKIGIKYSNFGAQLLRGDFGYIRSLEQQYSRDSEKINTVVLEEWLGGKGKEPKSWATLVEVLNDIELGELARQIKESIMESSNED